MSILSSQYSCVAVTGLHRGDNPQSGSATIRSIRRAYPDMKIIGLCYDPMESGVYSNEHDNADEMYLLPLPFMGPRALLERLKDIILISKIDMIIPCLDSEIDNYIAIKVELLNLGVAIHLPSKKSHRLRSKAYLPKLCGAIQVNVPDTCVVNNISDAYVFAENNGYPIYIKGRLYEAYLSYDYQQINENYNKIKANWGLPILAQQCLIGEEYNVIGIGDGNGGIITFCQIRKLLRTSAGKGFAGVVIDDLILVKLTEKIIKKLVWNGPFELEFIKIASGIYYLLEVNPRFPAWVDFPSQLGCNMPAALMAGQSANMAEITKICQPGKMFVRHCIDIAGDMADFADLSIDGMRVDKRTEYKVNLCQ